MSIEKSELQKIAKLSALKFSDEELERYIHDLNSIVDFCEKIDSVDTSSVSQGIHPTNNMQEREDICYDCDSSVMNNAPDRVCNMFAVPKVIEG